MSMLLVYLFITMDSLIWGFIIGFICAAIAVVIGLCCFIDNEAPELGRRWLKWSFSSFILLGLLWIATPNTNQFAAIYLIPKIANNEDVQAISGDAMKMLRIKFNDYLDSIDPVKEVVEAITEGDQDEDTGASYP